MKTKYDELHYREMPEDGLRNDWLRCQIGRLTMRKHDPRYPAERVFELIGYGRTMPDAEEMVERKFGRVMELGKQENRNGNGSL